MSEEMWDKLFKRIDEIENQIRVLGERIKRLEEEFSNLLRWHEWMGDYKGLLCRYNMGSICLAFGYDKPLEGWETLKLPDEKYHPRAKGFLCSLCYAFEKRP